MIVIDLGGTAFRVACFNPATRTVSGMMRLPTLAAQGPDDLVMRMTRAITTIDRQSDRIVVAAPGLRNEMVERARARIFGEHTYRHRLQHLHQVLAGRFSS